MASETRTVHFTIAPRLAAYLAWLDRRPGREFDLAQYDLFCANYREDDKPNESMIERAIRIPLERPR